jgi:hypothetical protein
MSETADRIDPGELRALLSRLSTRLRELRGRL